MNRLRYVSATAVLLLCLATPMASAGQPAGAGHSAVTDAPALDNRPRDGEIPVCC